MEGSHTTTLPLTWPVMRCISGRPAELLRVWPLLMLLLPMASCECRALLPNWLRLPAPAVEGTRRVEAQWTMVMQVVGDLRGVKGRVHVVVMVSGPVSGTKRAYCNSFPAKAMVSHHMC